jgi:hypothetical protein
VSMAANDGERKAERTPSAWRNDYPSAFLTSRSFTIPGGMSGGRRFSKSGR